MTRALIWVPLAVSFVIGLAAVVRMASPTIGTGADIRGAIRLPPPVTGAIVTLFSLAAVVFLADLLRRSAARRRDEEEGEDSAPEVRPLPGWLRALSQLLTIAYFVLVAYVLWRGAAPLANVMWLGSNDATGLASRLPLTPPSAPPFITWTFAGLALAAGLGALAVALWVAFGERLATWWERRATDVPAEPLAAAVEESLEDLRVEADPRRAIIRCYARFERVAARSGVNRHPWSTPAEFMREALHRLPVPRAAVPALTGLFELARFSHHPLDIAERDRALAALHEIRAAIDERPGDVPPG